MQGISEHIDKAVMNSLKGVVLQLGIWLRNNFSP